MHDKHVLVDDACMCFQALHVVCRNASVIWQHMTQWVWETVLRNLNDDARSQEIQSVRDISQEQWDVCLLNESKLEVSVHLTSGSPLRDSLYSVWNQILAWCIQLIRNLLWCRNSIYFSALLCSDKCHSLTTSGELSVN